MKLTVVRTQFGTDATNGMLFIDGIFECYTLEDQYQAVKVMHETCIPEGTYDIKFRTVGGFHEKYKKRYGNVCTSIIDKSYTHYLPPQQPLPQQSILFSFSKTNG